ATAGRLRIGCRRIKGDLITLAPEATLKGCRWGGPLQVAQIDLRPSVDVTCASNASTLTCFGDSDRSTRAGRTEPHGRLANHAWHPAAVDHGIRPRFAIGALLAVTSAAILIEHEGRRPHPVCHRTG